MRKVGSWYICQDIWLSPSGAHQTYAFKVTKNNPKFLFIDAQFEAISIEAWKACGIYVGGEKDGQMSEKICFYESTLWYDPQLYTYLEVTDPKAITTLEKKLADLRKEDEADKKELQAKSKVESAKVHREMGLSINRVA